MKTCECGCGEPTRLATKTNSKRGWVKGRPVRFIQGHNARGRYKDALPRLIERIDFTTGDCWQWVGSLNSDGYAQLCIRGENRKAHRLLYELLTRPIPDGLQIDHLCRNRACVNPAHLEAVTQRVNQLRGKGASAKNWVKTHCPKGHPYDEENTYVYRGKRYCRTCHRERGRRTSQAVAA